MIKAGEIMTVPEVLVGEASDGREAVEALLRRGAEVVGLLEHGRLSGIITFYSVLCAAGAERPPRLLRAKELALAGVAPLSREAEWTSFLDGLRRYGVLPVAGARGELCGAVTAAALAAELGRRQEELEREIDAIINFSSDEILVADGEGTVLRANSVFEENFGVKVAEILGRKVEELEKRKVFFPSVTRLVLQKGSAQTVIQSQRNGRKLLATGTPAFNPDGGIFRVVVNTRDITRLNELRLRLEEAELVKNRYYQELVELRRSGTAAGEILAESVPMLKLLATARKIAPVDSTVLLTGESGVGKGMVARYIHDYSVRRKKPFITVNCGAIPENLLESELFGYAGGAFTGARAEGKIGKLELAHEGTLFLDEITELPLPLQVKLLHVLQEGVISRIGETREIRLDLRIIAASNRDVAGLVSAGAFREDLYFRLNVIPLEIPPLRERPADIAPLALHFLERFNRKYHRRKRLDPAVFDYLTSYHWPGNVRELSNLIERLVIVVDGELIAPPHLPRHVIGRNAAEAGKAPPPFFPQPLEQAKENLEKEMLRQALQRCRSTYEIAALLKVNQSTIVRKLKKYGLGMPGQAPAPADAASPRPRL